MNTSTKSAAEHYGVTQYTIEKWCRTGFLVAFKVGKRWRVNIPASDERIQQAGQK